MRKEIKMERFVDRIQMSARMTIEATGVALMVDKSGRKSTRTGENAQESAASKIPSTVLNAKPASMRPKEPNTA